MGHIFFIADTHFGEDAIRRYENRPFADVSSMDDALVANWNRTVSNEDTVIHLGDFAAHGTERRLLTQLHGRKLLVRGNHDDKSNAFYRDAGFDEVYDFPILYGGFFLLSHEPLYVNENMPYANLFGHVHNSPLFRTCSRRHYCVCVERIGYTPISFEAIRAALQQAENTQTDAQ